VTGRAPPVVLAAEGLVGGYVPELDVLRGCSLAARQGELVVVVGPNGAGKSTLAKAIFGLVHVRAGAVTLHGADITAARPHEITARGMSYVPQRANVFPSLTVQENLELGAIARRSETPGRVAAMLELFPALAGRRRQRAGTMSGGERQMLAMARALVPEPTVLLLDEPSAGLAPQVVEEVFTTVARVNAAGTTVVMIEQNARRALAMADRGYVLEGGQNRVTGTGAELLADTRVVELYLGGRPRLPGGEDPSGAATAGDATAPAPPDVGATGRP
jgi:ABC-type branched-subunit amino acid transport system ATPase component